MPKIEEYCEVRTGGGVFRDWTSIGLSESFASESWVRQFRLETAEPNPRVLKLKPEDRIDVALAGNLFIKEGYIVTRQAAYDASRHAVQVGGYSKAGQTTKVSIDLPGGGQFRNSSLTAVANAVLKPQGLKFRVENGPDGHDLPFPNVAVRFGETPFAMVSRLCRMRGMWMRAEPDGTIVAGKTDKGGAVLEEGRNILAASCSIEMRSVQEVIANSQQPGSDSLSGQPAAEVQAKAPLASGPSGAKTKVLAEQAASSRELQLRANMEVAAIEASVMRVQVTHQGWCKPGASDLWTLGESVTVRSPMLFPIEGGEMKLRVFGISYGQDAQNGTVTTIQCVNRNAFQERFPDATAGDNYFNPNSSKPAQSEEPT